MSAEKKTALSTCSALMRISRKRSVQPLRRGMRGCASGPAEEAVRQTSAAGRAFPPVPLEIPEDVLHQDHRRIHNDAEVNRADGKQVGAFALHRPAA